MARTSMFEPGSSLSLVIGVTGHRDLRVADVPRLESSLSSAFLNVHRKYPACSAVLLSSLAEGADRLAARVALEAGMQLVVPLPLPQAIYETDFETPESRAEFRTLLSAASGVISLPLLPGVTDDDVRQHGAARDSEYAKVGTYIARHSQIFFALWDGTPDNGQKVGGTAQTVRFRLEGAPAPYASPRSTLEARFAGGAVLHLETPRQSNPGSASLSCTVARTLLPGVASASSVDQICRRVDLFNRDVRKLRVDLERIGNTSKAQLLNAAPDAIGSVLSSLPPSSRHVLDPYVAADALAVHFRSKALSMWKRVSFGVAIAAMFFNMHSSFFSADASAPSSVAEGLARLPWFLLAFLVCSAFTAIGLYGRARKREYQTKYQDYRALAEALRIQFFWSIAGVDEPVVDSYLRKQRSELEWIRSALLSCDVWRAADEGTSHGSVMPLRGRLALISEWIHTQRGYFASKAQSETRELEKESRIIEWLLKASGALSVCLALSLAIPLFVAMMPGSTLLRAVPNYWVHGVLMVVIPMLAVTAGILHAYGTQLARSEHIRRFSRMMDLFRSADTEMDRLSEENNDQAAVALIRELGLEALDENSEWLILHRERPLELPPG